MSLVTQNNPASIWSVIDQWKVSVSRTWQESDVPADYDEMYDYDTSRGKGNKDKVRQLRYIVTQFCMVNKDTL